MLTGSPQLVCVEEDEVCVFSPYPCQPQEVGCPLPTPPHMLTTVHTMISDLHTCSWEVLYVKVHATRILTRGPQLSCGL